MCGQGFSGLSVAGKKEGDGTGESHQPFLEAVLGCK